MNLGIVQAAQQQYSTAEQSYKTALSYRHQYPDCLYNLGNLVISFAALCSITFCCMWCSVFHWTFMLFFVHLKFANFTCKEMPLTVTKFCLHPSNLQFVVLISEQSELSCLIYQLFIILCTVFRANSAWWSFGSMDECDSAETKSCQCVDQRHHFAWQSGCVRHFYIFTSIAVIILSFRF